LRQLQLIVSPDTILRWHRDLIRAHHTKISRRNRTGRPPTRRAIRALVLRLARENPAWGYRRIHGELAGLAIKVAPSTVWEILKVHGILPAPDRDHTTWSTFRRSQAKDIIAAGFFTATTLTGASHYVFAVIEHATRRVRILGATAHPSGTWVTQMAHNLTMDLQDTGAPVKYLIRDRDTKFTTAFDAVLGGEGIETIKCAVRVPRMNSIMERWVLSCRRELLDRTLIYNQAHLLDALRQFETHYNSHHTHRALHSAAPLRPIPEPITEPDEIDHLRVHRRDHLAGLLHEYAKAA